MSYDDHQGPFEGLWTANDVARYLKASRSWVYQKAEAGILPARHVGGLLRFEPSVIRDFSQGKYSKAKVSRLRSLK